MHWFQSCVNVVSIFCFTSLRSAKSQNSTQHSRCLHRTPTTLFQNFFHLHHCQTTTHAVLNKMKFVLIFLFWKFVINLNVCSLMHSKLRWNSRAEDANAHRICQKTCVAGKCSNHRLTNWWGLLHIWFSCMKFWNLKSYIGRNHFENWIVWCKSWSYRRFWFIWS